MRERSEGTNPRRGRASMYGVCVRGEGEGRREKDFL